MKTTYVAKKRYWKLKRDHKKIVKSMFVSAISICVKSKHECSLEDEDNSAYLGAASICSSLEVRDQVMKH